MSQAQADILIRQLGGFGRLRAMLGSKLTFMRGYTETGHPELTMKFSNRSGPNVVKIALSPADLYDVRFFRTRGYSATPKGTHRGIYAGQLKALIEQQTGLMLSLNNNPRSRKKNSSALDEAQALVEALTKGVKAPFVQAYVSRLGGAHRPSVMLTFSIDPRPSWPNGILQNSRYGQVSFNWPERKFEHFSGSGLGKLRKAGFKTNAAAVARINKWIAAVKAGAGY